MEQYLNKDVCILTQDGHVYIVRIILLELTSALHRLIKLLLRTIGNIAWL
eukprot:m.778922 g.778922  ORF g.778922 m.778922 type:complete len:50 (-) comp59124_c0_seq11:4-153(-)